MTSGHVLKEVNIDERVVSEPIQYVELYKNYTLRSNNSFFF